MSNDEVDVTLVTLYSVFSLLVLISNGIVVFVVVKSRHLHLPTLWNIAFMAAWDFALGLYFLILVVPSKIMNAFAYSEKLKMPASIALLLITGQNILNIVVALVDRYISICWPLRYPRLMSFRRFTMAVAAVFSINFVRVFFVILTNRDVKYYHGLGVCVSAGELSAQIASFGFICITCVVIVFLLVTVLVKLWKVRRKMSISRSRIGSTQFTLTICLSTIAFILCFLPIGITVGVGATFGIERVPQFFVKIAFTCVLSNSLLNVYIYTFTFKPFKDASLRLFFPTISRDRARRKIQLEFAQNRTQCFRVCDSFQ